MCEATAIRRLGGIESAKMEDRSQPKAWDADEELRKLIESNDELKFVYRKLGYSVHVDREWQRTLNQLKSLTGTVVVDPAPWGFGRLLYDVRTFRFNRLRDSQRDSPTKRKLGSRARSDLSKYHKVNSPEKLKDFFNRHPRAARVVSLLLLGQLEQLFMDARWSLSPGDRSALLSGVNRAREATESCSPNLESLATALTSLEEARRVWLRYGVGDDHPIYEQRKQLYDLLTNSLWVRHIAGQDDAQWHRDAANQAKTYLDSTWMHTPWLTARFLTDLFDVELAPLNREAASGGQSELQFHRPILWVFDPRYYFWRRKLGRVRARLSRLAVLLKQVRDEVDLGNYDSGELAHRLRRFEGEGLYVHSLAYALLRLSP